MIERNDGGPAFPVMWGEGINPDSGMTLRDYFAAKAMQSIYSDPVIFEQWNGDEDLLSFAEYAANLAYEMADAMIKERSK